MSDPAILFVKPKAISQRDKKALQAAGIFVIEVDDVNNVKFVRAYAEMSTTEMLQAAMVAESQSQVLILTMHLAAGYQPSLAGLHLAARS